MLEPDAVRVADDDHGLCRDRSHLLVGDVLVVEAEHLHLLDVRIERRGVRRVLLERLLDRCPGERSGAETRECLRTPRGR
jgi:hypothetical protein